MSNHPIRLVQLRIGKKKKQKTVEMEEITINYFENYPLE